MKRRTALVSSAVVSIAVLGGAVAAAALSGVGVLGFGSASGTGGPRGIASSPTGDPVVVADTVSDSGVRVRVIEDRVVVVSPAVTGSDDIVRSAVNDALRARSGVSGLASDDGDAGSSTTLPVVSPPSTPVRDDDHDEYDEYENDDEYDDDDEHEHEYEGHDEHEESRDG